MRKKNKIQFLSIGVCIFFLGIICLVISRAEKPRGEDIVFDNQLTDIEKENIEHGWVAKHVTTVLERVDIIQSCEVNISWLEGEAVGADIKAAVAADSTGDDTLKSNIAECVSKMLDISTENIVISFVNEVHL